MVIQRLFALAVFKNKGNWCYDKNLHFFLLKTGLGHLVKKSKIPQKGGQFFKLFSLCREEKYLDIPNAVQGKVFTNDLKLGFLSIFRCTCKNIFTLVKKYWIGPRLRS